MNQMRAVVVAVGTAGAGDRSFGRRGPPRDRNGKLRGSVRGRVRATKIRFRPAAEGLAQLAQMVADDQLHPQIELEAPFAQIAEVAQKLYNRGIAGKAVLNL